MAPKPSFELITPEVLVEKARGLKAQGYRLVQIGATRLPGELELTYSFDRESELVNLRLAVPELDAGVPSISSVFWCAFLYENEMHDLFGLEAEGLAVNFHGNLYRTPVKFPFGSTRAPVANPGGPATPQVAPNSHP